MTRNTITKLNTTLVYYIYVVVMTTASALVPVAVYSFINK